jgi:hypothetical protein
VHVKFVDHLIVCQDDEVQIGFNEFVVVNGRLKVDFFVVIEITGDGYVGEVRARFGVVVDFVRRPEMIGCP